MNDCLYKHVLFKDLREYIRREDYMGGYTPTEKAWIRKNLDIEGSNESVKEVSYKDLIQLKETESLEPGYLYMIRYLDKYKILVMAYSSSEFIKNAILITDDLNSLLWEVLFDVENNKVIYLKDENGNEANFDFKHIKITVFDEEGYMFYNELGEENSKNCFDNHFCNANNIRVFGSSNHNNISGNNILFKTQVNYLIGTINNKIINTEEIGLSDTSIKQTINLNNKQYIDYLDLETLTHQLYEL